MKKNGGHIVLRNQNLFCLNCGQEWEITYPIKVKEFAEKLKGFNLLHKNCEKTWIEPQADQRDDVVKRAMWWIANGERGLSSETMWNCLIGNLDYPIHHPYDPDDFGRCHKLLQTIPEWKNELYRLCKLSAEWNNLVINWDKLTEMYEKNVGENCKHYKENGMYDFMQSLIIHPPNKVNQIGGMK